MGIWKNLRPIVRSAMKVLQQHPGDIALIVAGIGYTAAVVEGCKATVKAVRKTDYEADKKGESLTPKELVKTNWKYYVKPGMLFIGSTAALITGGSKYNAKIKGLTTLLTLYEAAAKDKDAAIEELGKKKAVDIFDQANRNTVARTYDESVNVIHTGKGNMLCLDKFSGRYFRMSPENVQKAINNANYQLNRKQELSYNDYFYEISDDVPQTEYGEMVGWRLEDGLIEPRFTSCEVNGEACLVIDFYQRPYIEYDRY